LNIIFPLSSIVFNELQTKINNTESLDMAKKIIVFASSVVVIYLYPKVVNVSCDNNVMKLAYIIIVQNFPITFNKNNKTFGSLNAKKVL
jgi:hypothetical protein